MLAALAAMTINSSPSVADVFPLQDVPRSVGAKAHTAHGLGSRIRRFFTRRPLGSRIRRLFTRRPRPLHSPFSVRIASSKLDPEVQRTIKRRLDHPELASTILGALGYLDDMQIRSRPGRGGAHRKSARDRGCWATIKSYLPGLKDPIHLPLPGVKGKNVEGEWASYIHAGSQLFGLKKGKSIFNVQDSSLFSMAYIVLPLFLFSDQALPAQKRFVSNMRRLVNRSIRLYKRGDAYNFWRPRAAERPGETVVGPTHLPPRQVDKIIKVITRKPWARLASFVTKRVHPEIWQWCKEASNPRTNTLGSDTYFNIPNDADDTSLAVAIQRLHRRDFDPTSSDSYNRSSNNFSVDIKALSLVTRYRDLNRRKHTTLDAWKGPDTGAFMTWLRDEDAPTFGKRSLGVIPGGVNLVDEVVNANVVFAMALNGLERGPGFRAAEKLIARAAASGQWKRGGIFYPGSMSFPYAASRAYRDGGARSPVMKTAMKILLRDMLRLQRQHGQRHPRQAGAFPGGIDRQTHLSTALGVNFLLNAGEGLAVEAGLRAPYRRALSAGIRYLLRVRIPHRLRRQKLFEPRRGVKWREGICGAGDPDGLSQWVSEAASTAMALEVFSKYAMAYDKTDNTILNGSRIELFQRGARPPPPAR